MENVGVRMAKSKGFTKKQISQCREELRQWLEKWTGCVVQTGFDKNGKYDETGGWACGTCTCYLLGCLGVHEVGRHNKPIDRVNEVWRAILQIRGEDDA
jgi:hypothetical protein